MATKVSAFFDHLPGRKLELPDTTWFVPWGFLAMALYFVGFAFTADYSWAWVLMLPWAGFILYAVGGLVWLNKRNPRLWFWIITIPLVELLVILIIRIV